MKPTKEPVRLRTATLKNGVQSLYLDTYHNGVRKYEFLKLYLLPDTTPEARKQNAETMRSANVIKARRIVELINRKGGIKANDKAIQKITLGAFIEAYIKKREKNGDNVKNYKILAKNLTKWKMSSIKLSQIDRVFCLDLIDTINRQQWTDSTKFEVQCKIKAVLNDAQRNDFIDTNPFNTIDRHDRIKTPTENNREYLTIEELNKMINTPYRHERHRNAFLFSCFTGLRLSDIRGLKWENIQRNGERLEIRLTMKKTKRTVIVPLNEQAQKYLPPRKRNENNTDKVFKQIEGGTMSARVQEWARLSGVTKHITFHSARHTFATMLLTLGADIFTISKLLGHTSIQHTQIYAKLIDAKRAQAVRLFDGHFI